MMKDKFYIGRGMDDDVCDGQLITWEVDDVQSITQTRDGWILITVSGCAYDLFDLKVIEGNFNYRDPLPSDSRS